MRTDHRECRIPFLTLWLVAGLVVLYPPPALCQTYTLTGTAVSKAPGGERFAVAGAKVTLSAVTGPATEQPAPPPAETDKWGRFRFPDLPEGCYLVTGESSALRGQSDLLCLPGAETERFTLEMGPKIIVESIDVTAAAIGIDPTETSSTGAVGVSTLYDAPKLNKRYDDVMPLIPGSFKGPSGEINMNGSRTTQSGARFNGVDITDPVIGSSVFSVPLDTVSNVEVLSSPFDAQYGGFTGALSTVQTKPADMSDFKVALQDFVPRVRRRDGNIVGIEAFAPRFTLTGPIRKGKLAFLHSTEYHFIRLPQDDANLPPLARDTERETLTVFNQLDIRHTDRNSSTIGLLIYPAKINFFGLNAFNLQQSTPDLRRRGYVFTFGNRHDFRAGAALLSQFSYQRLDKDVKPLGYDPYVVGLERTTGSFFNREAREANRWQWTEQYNFAPFNKRGSHQLRAGFEFARASFSGRQTFNPITWLGAADQPVLRAIFGPPADLSASKRDYAAFLQDTWEPISSLTLDLGVRYERDSIIARNNPSYRAGFAYSIGPEAHTVIRGGVGLFYGRATLLIPAFPNLPARTETTFDASGNVASVLLFRNRLGDSLRNPRTLGWSVQIDHEVGKDLLLRAGYQQRRTTDNFVVERDLGPPALNFFTLRGTGRDHYREWQFTARYLLPRNGHVTASYVRSSSVGDLNDLGSIYGPTPAELIRPNQRAPLAFDAPNRLVVWAEFALPLDIRAIPVVELRSGYPYSEVDELRDYVGAANRAGRFRQYRTFDLQVTKVFQIKFRGKQRRIRFGVRLFNLFDTFNPQDVQNNIASPLHGTFYRGVKRRVRFLFGFGN